jgi:Uma2 family endonuclease
METETTALAAGAPAPTRRMSYEEFLDWCDEDTLAEWVDGEVQMTSPCSDPHQALVGFLQSILQFWVEERELGLIRTAPFQMRLITPPRGREPDLFFLARAHRDRLRRTYLEGPADLVIEVVSPESVGRDRGDKFVEYEQAGIPEYWLIDPDRRQAEFYQSGPDGRYRLALGGETGTYVSPGLAGLALPVEWLWEDPLPPLRTAFRALGLLP